MTQPLPPAADIATACTAHRYAANVWVRGVAHPIHHCTIPARPHPTQPHVCGCGDAWPGVGIVQCSECLSVLPLTGVRKADDGKGSVVYICLDRARCGMRATPGRVGLDAVAAGDGDDHTACEPADCDVAAYVTEAAAARRLSAAGEASARGAVVTIPAQRKRPESDSAVPRLPASTDGPHDSAAGHLTAALALLANLQEIAKQRWMPAPTQLRQMLAEIGDEIRKAQDRPAPTSPRKRVPGQIRHGEVQNGGKLT